MSDQPESLPFRYAVVRVGPEWKVVGARRAIGHFATRDLALAAARNLALLVVDEGHPAEVLVQSESGELTRLKLHPPPDPETPVQP